MFIFEMAGGIVVGAVIVFVGVWMVKSWGVAGHVTRSVMVIVLAVALGAVGLSFFRVVPSKILWSFAGALSVFLACSFLLGLYRVWRERWAQRPEKWGAWLFREIGKALFLPMAIVVVLASVMSTIAFFATMQKGPQTGQLIFEMSAITAACWAVVLVGGVWAGQRTQDR